MATTPACCDGRHEVRVECCFLPRGSSRPRVHIYSTPRLRRTLSSRHTCGFLYTTAVHNLKKNMTTAGRYDVVVLAGHSEFGHTFRQKRGTKCLQNSTRVSLTATQNKPHSVRRHGIIAAPQAAQQHGPRCTTSQAQSSCLPSEEPPWTNLLRQEQPRGLRRQVDDREKMCRI